MRVHRARFLHILVIAPVAAILAGVLGPTPRALAAPSKAPSPIVVTVDPGFGGQPSAAHPNVPFDPGVIGVNGILEKDVDLDVGSRLAALLRTDLVDVVMTRSTDVYVSDAQRQRISTTRHAVLVVSIVANTSSNARTAGSLVTYPSATSKPFAQTVSDALGAGIGPDGVPDLGIAADPKAWPESRVPTASVKMAYLSNTSEAALMTTASFRNDVAAAIRSGLEAYMPSIVARRNEIKAWRDAHPGARLPVARAGISDYPGGHGISFRSAHLVAPRNRCGRAGAALPRRGRSGARGDHRDRRAPVRWTDVVAARGDSSTTPAPSGAHRHEGRAAI